MANELTSQIELYDTDILVIEDVVKRLNERARGPVNVDAFKREAEERFHDAGFKVNVKVWYSDKAGVYPIDIEVCERVDPHEFDRDRQAHEVVHDTLGIGDGGVINTKSKTPTVRDPSGLHVVSRDIKKNGDGS